MQDIQALLGSSRLHLETFLRTFLTFTHPTTNTSVGHSQLSHAGEALGCL